MTNPDAVKTMMQLAKEFKNYGGPDIVVNNAGMQHVASIEDMPIEVRCRLGGFSPKRAALTYPRMLRRCGTSSLRST